MPFDPFGGPWEPLEQLLRVPALPSDYKTYCQVYGTGCILDFIRVFAPGSRHPDNRPEAWAVPSRAILGADTPQHLLWPAHGSLLPWGNTINADMLFWLTRGHPDEWPVVVHSRGDGCLELFEVGLSDFLLGVAKGAIRPEAFPEDVWPADMLFWPASL